MTVTALPTDAPLSTSRRPAASLRWLVRVLWSAVAAVLLFGAWYWLAPPQLGGRTSYAITRGTSMLPEFRTGDFVMLRSEPTYHVGEVAAYHNMQLKGAVVMHEIIAIHHGHYVFKGINNPAADFYRPTKAQIVGAVWVHVHGIGSYLLTLHDPWIGAVLIFALAVFSFSTPARRRARKRRRHHATS